MFLDIFNNQVAEQFNQNLTNFKQLHKFDSYWPSNYWNLHDVEYSIEDYYFYHSLYGVPHLDLVKNPTKFYMGDSKTKSFKVSHEYNYEVNKVYES